MEPQTNGYQDEVFLPWLANRLERDDNGHDEVADARRRDQDEARRRDQAEIEKLRVRRIQVAGEIEQSRVRRIQVAAEIGRLRTRLAQVVAEIDRLTN